MTTLELLNGKKYDVKEDVKTIDGEIAASLLWIRLTLIRYKLSSQSEYKQARFMINAIACYY